jgi:hypothetical protein
MAIIRTVSTSAVLALVLQVWALGQVRPPDGRTDSSKAAPTVEKPTLIAGVKYQSGSRMDPFLNPVLIKKENELRLKASEEEETRGQPPAGIAGMYIAQVMLVGVSHAEGKRTAVFRGTDKRAYFLQNGDKLFDGYLKEIGTDEVLMVRETNFKSGKIVTQEVHKRLRTP